VTEIIADTRTLQNSRASDWLRISAGNFPDRLCYATDTESFTFAEIESRVNRLATSLQGLGVHKGSRVALFATDSPRYMEILLACMKLGAVYVPLNFRLARPELETLLRASESQVLFFSDRYRELVEAVDAPTLEYRISIDSGAGDADQDSPSLKVIADHIRACSFTVVDGVIPSNAGRGYVLRRIARRAIRHGYKLGARKPFFHTLVPALAAEMGDAYPELRRDQQRAFDVLKQEEEGFFRTIANGMEILEKALSTGTKQLDGDTAFKLHDTYGFPVDLTADVCRERGVTVDEARFDTLLEEQRTRAREAGKFKMAAGLEYSGAATQFHGYDELAREGVKVTAVYVDGSPVASSS